MIRNPGNTKVVVRNPVTHNRELGKYTDYEICIQTSNIAFDFQESEAVRRRFREFVWLREKLADASIGGLPEVPPKTFFGRFEEDFIQRRTDELQEFLQKLVAIPAVLTEKVFHEFVQTSNKLEDMERMYDTTHPLAGRPDLAVEPTILLVKDIVASRQICRDPAEEHSAERPSHSEESRLPHNAECPSHSTERLSQSAEPPLHSGERPQYSAEPPLHSGERPQYSAEPPLHSGERPQYSAERPSYSAERPSYSAERPSYSGESPPYSTERLSCSAEPQLHSAEHPTYSAERPPYSAERPPYTAERPPCTAVRPPYSAESPTYSAERPTNSAERPPSTAECPPYTAERPPYSVERLPYNAESPPYSAERPPYSAESPSDTAEVATHSAGCPPYSGQHPSRSAECASASVISGEPDHQGSSTLSWSDSHTQPSSPSLVTNARIQRSDLHTIRHDNNAIHEKSTAAATIVERPVALNPFVNSVAIADESGCYSDRC